MSSSRRDREDMLAAALVTAPALRFDMPEALAPSMLVTDVARKVVGAVLELAERGECDGGKLLDAPTVAEAAGVGVGEVLALTDRGQRLGRTNVRRACKAILEAHLRDRIGATLRDTLDALKGERRVGEVLAAHQAALAELDDGAGSNLEHVDEVGARFRERVRKVKASEDPDAYLTTGIPALDTLGKWWWGSYVVMAARPGKGKSTLALNIALRASEQMREQRRGAVLLHSYEMAGEETYAKLMSDASARQTWDNRTDGVSVERMFDDSTHEATSWAASMNRAQERLTGLPIWVNTGNNRLGDVLRMSRMAIRKHGVRLIIVDYLQLVEHASATRYQAVSEISRALRMLALQETQAGFPVVVLPISQLSRPKKGEEHKPPTMSDLRDSGQIEQDATHIWLMHDLDDVPKPKTKDESKIAAWESNRGHVMVFTPKQRLSASNRYVMLRKQLEFSRLVPSERRLEE